MKKKKESGQAIVEFALVLPIFLLLLCAVIDFGWVLTHELTLSSAVREGARTGITCVSESDFQTQVKNRVQTVASVPSSSTLTVTATKTNMASPKDGDVVVQASYDLQLLTPMGKLIFGSMQYEIENSCTMKAE